MTPLTEHLDGPGALKATMLQAHLDWAEAEMPGITEKVMARISEDSRLLLDAGLLATQWIPFSRFVEIDRAISGLMGGDELEVWRRMGGHSAAINLGGVYKAFVKRQPHRFFERMTVLHGRFQSFGRPVYEEISERAGRIRIDECEQFSPVYCASARGYYEGALRMMKVPGPVKVDEALCQCAEDAICLYEMAW